MKTLYIIRHAKSDWNTGQKDHDRPLNQRGVGDAPRMGKHLKEEEKSPELIISSTANRAISTARLIAKEVGYDLAHIQQTENLYHASPKEIVKEIWKVPQSVDTLYCFGHNPGVSQMIEYLTDDFVELKTCCVAKITFDLDDWNAIVQGTGILTKIISPKEI